MSVKHVVVDGSNIATEGRDTPSLAQLDEAVTAFIEEYSPTHVTVVVDATFPNRIDPKERKRYEEAVNAGELITPPAGAIGRGDAFILEIARRANAAILSNDSFQEFHGEYPWLFDKGRLIGGKPVPHVGWVFMDRAPVRGPASRRAVSEARKVAKAAEKAAEKAEQAAETAAEAAAAGKAAAGIAAAEDGAATAAPRRRARKRAAEPVEEEPVAPAKRRARKRAAEPVEEQPVAPAKRRARKRAAEPVEEEPVALAKRRARKRAAEPVEEEPVAAAATGDGTAPAEGARAAKGLEPYNEALPFIEFVSRHPIGSEVDAVVERFSSHGAYVRAGAALAYVPLRNLADPAPRSAREVLRLGEERRFVVVEIDPPRRGIDVALPGVVDVPTTPVLAGEAAPDEAGGDGAAARKAAPAKKKAAPKKAAAKKTAAGEPASDEAAAKQAPTRKKAAPKKAAAKKAAPKKATAKKAAPKKAPAKTTAAEKKKAAPRKAAAKRAAAPKKVPAEPAAGQPGAAAGGRSGLVSLAGEAETRPGGGQRAGEGAAARAVSG